MQHLVSVIVPIYNVEPYLRECLDSLHSQSYKNLEIIMVENGSSDHSAEIAQEYADKYDTFHLIVSPRRGSSIARNIGLDHAKGEYITFVDSDDWCCPDFIADLLAAIQSSDADFSVCDFYINQTPAGQWSDGIYAGGGYIKRIFK